MCNIVRKNKNIVIQRNLHYRSCGSIILLNQIIVDLHHQRVRDSDCEWPNDPLDTNSTTKDMTSTTDGNGLEKSNANASNGRFSHVVLTPQPGDDAHTVLYYLKTYLPYCM